MKPLYKKENSEITIRRGPEDIIWFCVFAYIMAFLFEAMILMFGMSLLKVIILLINPVLSICLCKFTAKRYENTWVRITEEKIIFNTAGKTKEIELNNLEKVTLDGQSKGITSYDLVMKFIMKDGSGYSFSYLGMNTYLFLNNLSMRNISIYEKNEPYKVQLVLMDILDEDTLSKYLEETQECLKYLAEKHSNIGFSYSIHKVGKGYENWGSVVMPENKSFSGLISAKRYGQIFSYNFIEYCEFYIKSCKGENEWDEISHIGKDGRL